MANIFKGHDGVYRDFWEPRTGVNPTWRREFKALMYKLFMKIYGVADEMYTCLPTFFILRMWQTRRMHRLMVSGYRSVWTPPIPGVLQVRRQP